MKSDNKFVVLTLDDDKANEVSQILSNKTSKTILEHLSNKDYSTASDLSKSLNIPLSTIHYNLNKLEEAKLLETNEYHYSEKGREVTHYKLTGKYIIIAPTKDKSFLTELRKILPGFILLSILSATILLLESINVLPSTISPDSDALTATETVRDVQATETALFLTEPIALTVFLAGTVTLIFLALWNKYT